MHKYWGRKAHNIVADYIKRYTKETETVLDPFMGSGVAIIEAAKLNRQVCGIDINPISKFIVDNSISKIDFEKFSDYYTMLVKRMEDKFGDYYTTECPQCQAKSEIEITVWDRSKPRKIRLVCPNHGIQTKTPTDYDIRNIARADGLFKTLENANRLRYPKDDILKYVKRSGVSRIDELFTRRALVVLSFLLDEIGRIKDREISDCFKFIFSSMLPNVSKMIPADLEKCTYKSGWVISKFWVPSIHTERSIPHCFKLRFHAIFEGKKELSSLKNNLIRTYLADSKKLPLESDSVDYIFTDPPYGESIAYLALSHFWNSWLKMTPKYANEIIIDPYRNKSASVFAENIAKAFNEMFRVLRPGKYLSFTFHNRDLNVWKGILEGCLKAGFVLKEIVLQSQAVSSGTQGINRNNTLKGDFIYTFIKPIGNRPQVKIQYLEDAHGFIIDRIHKYIGNNKGATTAKLYEYIIPEIVKNYAYLDKNKKIVDLEKLIQDNFLYERINGIYMWTIKNKQNNDAKLNVIDLFSGAGGFSEGFKQAGFNIVLAIEHDQRHRDTYLHNHQNTKLVLNTIKNVTANAERNGSFSIMQYLSDINKKCDIVVGGPPCQGFSMAGMRIRKKYQFLSDKRNYLFLEYFRIVKHLNPSVFVLENVPGILNFNNGSVKNEIISKFSEIGYQVHADVLNAADYGVPQNRQRAFFIGNKLGLDSKTLFPVSNNTKRVSVWDAIGDLPQISSGEGAEMIGADKNIDGLSDYQKMMRLDSNGFIFNHQAAKHSKETLAMLSLLKPGMRLKDLPQKYHTRSVHSGAYGRMEKHKPAYTLTTRLNTPSVGRITHPNSDRTITPREAARLQGFPDNYRFFGNITTMGIQIGNAVPPILAKQIAGNIMEKCFKHQQISVHFANAGSDRLRVAK